MKLSHVLVPGTFLALLGANALRVEKRDTPAVLSIPLQKITPGKSSVPGKKRQTVESPDVNYQNQLLYIVELQIGTPPQSTFVQLDTGSSDLIVETPLSDVCSTAPPNPCTNFGSYSPNSSSTYEYIDSNFQVAYGGGDGATGDWGLDSVSFGGAILQNAQFGVMYKSTVLEGILGVSYTIIEGRQTFSGEPEYENFPVLLVKQGYIASRAFSLWTNDDRSSSGTLLFGGIDTSKFSGQLVTIDLIPSGFDGFPGVVDFTLSLLGVSGTDAGGNPVTFNGGSTAINVLMDSGTTITQLPSDITTAIWAFVGATPYSNDPNSAYIPCAAGSTTEAINFAFDGITIVVPLSQLVIFPDSANEFCLFGISISGGDSIIGDSVLTAMYVVYDLDNNQISLAPTIFNSTATENILQIVAGPGGVPDTKPSSSSTSLSSTSSSVSSSTSSSTSSSSSSTSTSSSSSSETTSSRSSFASTSSSSSSVSTSSSSSSSTLSPTSSSSSSTLSSTTSTISSTSSTFVTSTTTSAPPFISKPDKCNVDNCLRAIQGGPGAIFCPAYQAGIPTPTPTAIAKGCKSLDSRVSSGCACFNPPTVVAPSTSATSTVSTSSWSTTAKPTVTAKPLKCKMDNCLRAISHSSATAFCSAYMTVAPVSVPTGIAKGCATSASRISSACNCLIQTV